MVSRHKHDIAISVAEEDLPVARQIAEALTKKGVSYYLYTEHRAANWGKHILRILLDTYGAEARYVLIITSEIFVRKHWANIERQISEIFNKRQQPYILQLRIDDTPVDGFSKYIVSEKWEDNPDEIARMIQEKLLFRQKLKLPKWSVQSKWIAISFVIIFCATFIFVNNGIKNRKEADVELKNQPNNILNPESKYHEPTPPRNYNQVSTPVNKGEDSNFKITKIFIKGNSFTMGNDTSATSISPSHTVTISPFYISPTEVTVSEYKIYCKEKGKALPPQIPHHFQDLCPVVNITWAEANEYCKWAGGRLPTEAEWEYAAGGGAQTKYSGANNASDVASYNISKPSKVATKKPNQFGLYDMTGNAAEWCSDWYDSTYYSVSPAINSYGPISGTKKVVRGGAYNSHIKPINELHIAYRSRELPNTRRSHIGFRVVWDFK